MGNTITTPNAIPSGWFDPILCFWSEAESHHYDPDERDDRKRDDYHEAREFEQRRDTFSLDNSADEVRYDFKCEQNAVKIKDAFRYLL